MIPGYPWNQLGYVQTLSKEGQDVAYRDGMAFTRWLLAWLLPQQGWAGQPHAVGAPELRNLRASRSLLPAADGTVRLNPRIDPGASPAVHPVRPLAGGSCKDKSLVIVGVRTFQ